MLFDANQLRDGFKERQDKKYTFKPPASRAMGEDGASERRCLLGATAPAGGALKESAKPPNLIVVAVTPTRMQGLSLGPHAELLRSERRERHCEQRRCLSPTPWTISQAARISSAFAAAPRSRGRSIARDALRRKAEDRFRSTEQRLEEELKSTGRELTQMQSRRDRSLVDDSLARAEKKSSASSRSRCASARNCATCAWA